MEIDYSQAFNKDVIINTFSEYIEDPRGFVLAAYCNDGVGVAYQQSTDLYIPVHLTENIFNWKGTTDYQEALVLKDDFLLCGDLVVAHLSGICTGFSVKYDKEITGIIRPSKEVLVVVYADYYHVYHLDGKAFVETDTIHIVDGKVFYFENDHYVCVDDLFTSIYDITKETLKDYPFRKKRLVEEEVPIHLRRFIDAHGFSSDR